MRTRKNLISIGTKYLSETREDVRIQTSTYRGKQFNIHPDAYVNEWKFKPHLQGVIDEVGLPIELTDLCALWIIEYKKGGWQKAHRHGDADVKKISAVVYLTDGDPDPTTYHGGTFVHSYDGQGNTHDPCYKPNRGDMLIQEYEFLLLLSCKREQESFCSRLFL